jgi:hypothetical protein
LRALERELPADAVSVAVGFEPVQRLVYAPGRSDERGIQTVSGGFAATFDLRVQHGRWIGPDDDRDGAPQQVAVISDGLWHELFGADPAIVKRRSITIFKKPFRIIAWRRQGLWACTRTGLTADVWIPLAVWLAAVDAGPLYSSLHLVIVGLLPAVFIAAIGSRLIESRQFDLMPNEISTWVVVPLLLITAGLVAGYFPARRAPRTDPNVCLREL